MVAVLPYVLAWWLWLSVVVVCRVFYVDVVEAEIMLLCTIHPAFADKSEGGKRELLPNEKPTQAAAQQWKQPNQRKQQKKAAASAEAISSSSKRSRDTQQQKQPEKKQRKKIPRETSQHHANEILLKSALKGSLNGSPRAKWAISCLHDIYVPNPFPDQCATSSTAAAPQPNESLHNQ